MVKKDGNTSKEVPKMLSFTKDMGEQGTEDCAVLK